MVIKIAEGTLDTKFGSYKEYLYYNGQKETIALVLGDVQGRRRFYAASTRPALPGMLSAALSVTAGSSLKFHNN